jgi:hypothetical protein
MAARQVYYSAQTAINPDGTLFALTRLTASTQRQTENSLKSILAACPHKPISLKNFLEP